MNPDLLQKYAKPAPRYTSYPTAPHFSPAVGPDKYLRWLSELSGDEPISLYAHFPFCQEMCWYCACTTKAVKRYQPVADYVPVLKREMSAVAKVLPKAITVSHVHFGGGSPSILSPADILDLGAHLREAFSFSPTAEFAVEIDPRGLSLETVAAFVNAGVNRVSLGVQDFDLRVQKAINRLQSYEETLRTAEAFRARGVGSVNIDLVYGLPLQTRDSLAKTLEKVLAIAPDRIAIFGYAHVPHKAHHQRMIDDAAVPGAEERFAQFQLVAARLKAAGYVQIGIDHFARPEDKLATERVRRNFQGYTTDDSTTLIGLGASAIGLLPQGYVQNAVSAAEYARRVHAHGVATVRGKELTRDDKVRAYVIERLMCDFSFSTRDVTEKFGADAEPVVRLAQELLASDEAGFAEKTPEGFVLSELGRIFVRTVCTRFDAYWGQGSSQHALAV